MKEMHYTWIFNSIQMQPTISFDLQNINRALLCSLVCRQSSTQDMMISIEADGNQRKLEQTKAEVEISSNGCCNCTHKNK